MPGIRLGSPRMEPDIRETPLYREVEAFYRRALEPGFGGLTNLDQPEPSPDGGRIAFVGYTLADLEGHPLGPDLPGRAATGPAGDGSRTARTTTPSPAGRRTARILTFRSDRAAKGRFQLYALRADAPRGGRNRVAERPGRRRAPPLVAPTAGASCSSSPARPRSRPTRWARARSPAPPTGPPGSPRSSRWTPTTTGGRCGSSTSTAGEARRVSRDGLNVWEATWLGDDRAAAVVSEAPGEGAWYASPLAVIDLATGHRTGAAHQRRPARIRGRPRRRATHRRDRGRLQRPLPRRRATSSWSTRRRARPGGRRARAATPLWHRWTGEALLASSLDGALGGRERRRRRPPRTATERWRSAVRRHLVGRARACPLATAGFVTDAVAHPRARPSRDRSATARSGVLVSVRHAGHDALLPHLGTVEAAPLDGARRPADRGILRTPPGEGPFPLILDVHGGPIWAETDLWPGVFGYLLLSRGYATLEPNPRGSIGRGRAFAAAVVGDMGGADALDDLAGVDLLVERGIADPSRIGVIGGSYGGFMAAWLPTSTTGSRSPCRSRRSRTGTPSTSTPR